MTGSLAVLCPETKKHTKRTGAAIRNCPGNSMERETEIVARAHREAAPLLWVETMERTRLDAAQCPVRDQDARPLLWRRHDARRFDLQGGSSQAAQGRQWRPIRGHGMPGHRGLGSNFWGPAGMVCTSCGGIKTRLFHLPFRVLVRHRTSSYPIGSLPCRPWLLAAKLRIPRTRLGVPSDTCAIYLGRSSALCLLLLESCDTHWTRCCRTSW